MIALDTNVLVRYIVKDDLDQTQAVIKLLGQNKCVLLPNVILETVWVLGSKKAYGLNRKIIVEKIRHIAGLPNIIIFDEEKLSLSLEWYENGMDFADALHLAMSEQYSQFATLDKKMYLTAKRIGVSARVLLLLAEQN
ncbi:MAG: type II toxin-antitoxin system VapC family toxin [Mariprofundales bacterium]